MFDFRSQNSIKEYLPPKDGKPDKPQAKTTKATQRTTVRQQSSTVRNTPKPPQKVSTPGKI